MPAARGQFKRRIDKPHVPARIAPGKLKTRREQHAALPVEPVGERRIGRRIGLRDDLSLDTDASSSRVQERKRMRTALAFWRRSQVSAPTSTLVVHRPGEINWMHHALKFALGRTMSELA